MTTIRGRIRLSFYATIALFLLPLFLPCLVATLPGLGADGDGGDPGATHRAQNKNNTASNRHRTRYINPIFCHSLTEEECHRLDENEGEQARRNRLFLTREGREELERRRKLQSAVHPFRSGVSFTSGTLNVLVCLLVWSDHEGQRELPDRSIYEELFNSDGTSDFIPSGSIKKWYEISSYGAFSIEATVADWVVTVNTEAFYSSPNRGRSDNIIEAFSPALQALDDSGFDFSKFDADGDGILDMVVFVHSGYDGQQDGLDQFGVPADLRIAAHARPGCTASTCWTSSDGAYKLGPYAVGSGYMGLLNFEPARIGIITHETLHCFGLPDLYDIQFAFVPGGSLGGLGNYDIMSNPRGQSDKLSWPGHVSAWTRWFMGWVEPMEITDPGSYQLRAVEQFPDVFRISKGYAANEFLLIENRQPIPGDFDERFYQPGGILIYHIDENNLELEGYGNSPAGGPYQAGWPGNGNHYPVALLQRDGLYELEQRLNLGHIEDVYIIGSDGLYPGSGQYPNTDSYARGNIQFTGIAIDNFREGTEPGSIRFDVTFQDETTSPTSKPAASSPTSDPSTDSPTPLSETVVPAVPTFFPTVIITPPTLNLTTPSPVTQPTPRPTRRPTKPPTEPPTQTPTETPTLLPRPTLPPYITIIRSGAYTASAPTEYPEGPPTSSSTMRTKSSKGSQKTSKKTKSKKSSKTPRGKGRGKGSQPGATKNHNYDDYDFIFDNNDDSNFNSKKRLQRFSTADLTKSLFDDIDYNDDNEDSHYNTNYNSKKRLQRFSTAGLTKRLGLWDHESSGDRADS